MRPAVPPVPANSAHPAHPAHPARPACPALPASSAHPAYPASNMSLSTILFLFLAHLGVGIVFTLVFVSREAGVKFFRFNAGLAAILLAVALAFAFNTAIPVATS